MDEMIDLAAAFAEGGLGGLREAIRQNDKKGNDMAEQQYDNDNQIALWKKDHCERGVYVGYGEMNGQKIHDAIFYTLDRRSFGRAPVGQLFYRTDAGAFAVGVYKNDSGKMGGSDDGHWFNLWQNDKGGKGPAIKFFINAKEPVGAGKGAGGGVADSEIPFAPEVMP